jgi:acyl-coenzyme A synthetase/AMP-(fatty) acid ligase
VGGLKVDLTEVGQELAALPVVAAAVVIFDRAVEAYVALAEPVATDPGAPERVDEVLASRLAPYKRPRAIHVLPQMPRTATGKLVRDLASLRRAASTPVT